MATSSREGNNGGAEAGGFESRIGQLPADKQAQVAALLEQLEGEESGGGQEASFEASASQTPQERVSEFLASLRGASARLRFEKIQGRIQTLNQEFEDRVSQIVDLPEGDPSASALEKAQNDNYEETRLLRKEAQIA